MIIMKKPLTLGLILILFLACISVASANLVNNGGFENPLVANSWDIFPDGTAGLDWSVQWANNPTSYNGKNIPAIANMELQKTNTVESIPSFEGIQHGELDADWDGPAGSLSGEPANVTISQTFATKAGARYSVSYEERCRPNDNHNPCTLQFDWTGAPSEITAGGMGTWTKYTFKREAAGTLTTISFTGSGMADSYGALIDDVEVVETEMPVPEFPTLFLPVVLIIGILGAVLFIRRTREH